MQNINNILKVKDDTVLDHSFQDACSDKGFKDYVYSLNIPEDTLKKYTYNLLESYEEHKNCKNCKNLSNCVNKIKGYKYTPQKDQNIISFSYVACKKLTDKLDEEAYKNNIELFDMPKEIANASLKNIHKDDKSRLPIIKYFKEFMEKYKNEEKPKGIYLSGSFGSGKTYMISALFNEMSKKYNTKSILIYYPEFLRTLKASFQNGYNEKFELVKKIPLLLFDDIGAENCSYWSRDEILGPILQYRMESNLPTFFTSNLSLEDLETALAITKNNVDKVKARRIIERIEQLTVPLELIGENRRK